MKSPRRYNSKVLLFGEYTVLHGSQALAVPFEKYFGTWNYEKNHPLTNALNPLKQHLMMLYQKEQLENFDFNEFEYQLSKGLYFDSNIPPGYGVGSSGSLTVAIYREFVTNSNQIRLDSLIKTLSSIEAHFHGSSSGTDPIVSYLNQPILIKSNKSIELIDAQNKAINKRLFLVDTGISRQTAPLVKAYLQTRRESEQFIMDMQAIAEINDDLINTYIGHSSDNLDDLMHTLSTKQLECMYMMIPQDFIKLWKYGIESGKYSMKLNGAGGGGFLMLYLHDELFDLKSQLSDYKIIKLSQ